MTILDTCARALARKDGFTEGGQFAEVISNVMPGYRDDVRLILRALLDNPDEGMRRAMLDASPMWPVREMRDRSGRASMTDAEAVEMFRAAINYALEERG